MSAQSESGLQSTAQHEIQRWIRRAVREEIAGDLDTTWTAEHAQVFAERVARRAVDLLATGPARPVLTVDQVRLVVREVAVDVLGPVGVRAAHLPADDIAARAAQRLVGCRVVVLARAGLRAEQRAILRRLRDNEARSRSSIGHLGEDVRRQCDDTIALLELLAGPEVDETSMGEVWSDGGGDATTRQGGRSTHGRANRVDGTDS